MQARNALIQDHAKVEFANRLTYNWLDEATTLTGSDIQVIVCGNRYMTGPSGGNPEKSIYLKGMGQDSTLYVWISVRRKSHLRVFW